MAGTTTNTYRAEVVGSLLRPDALKHAFARYERGEIDEAALTAAQEHAGLAAIALQEDCGIDIITDGEVRRRFWFDPLTVSLSGYNPEAPAPVPFSSRAGRSSEPPPKLPAVTERLGMARNLPLEEFSFVSAHASLPAKTTIAGMSYASVLWVPGVSHAVYPDRD
jgi:5-methyltetrahydropteroyltriglutamate--homocysteine methyltransferase